ncbi:unnamed protein product [Angiostrongylus costaricensis]|uniref:Apple domain-containing protein n=1 Tax=Angiostrongylus costaricensis TaxID=334426 RepID=A0A158PGG5_ANGCS|nr:unnamed protein product [Angiostrongylus costaricensis]
MKSSQEILSQRAEEQLSLTKEPHKRSQPRFDVEVVPAITLEIESMSINVDDERPYIVNTFSVPITRPELVVDKPVDGESRSLFKVWSKNWRLPPIRRGTISRHFYTNTEESTEKSSSCFTRIKQRALLDYEQQTISGVDVQICLHTCLHISSFYCASVNYDKLRHAIDSATFKMCTLNGGSVYFNNAELKNSTSDYYENECNQVRNSQRTVSSTATFGSIATLPTRCFEIMTNSVLLSFDGKLVENAASLEECQAACILSDRQCGALNWIPNRKGCMLFGIGYDMKSVVFSSNAQFLIHKCAGRKEPFKVQQKGDYYDERYESS